MTSRRFSCFTIDALIGNSHPGSSGSGGGGGPADDWPTTPAADATVQCVVSCSPPPLQEGQSPSPSTASSPDRRRPGVDDANGGGSRHAFRVYRPPSLRDTDPGAPPRADDSGGGILATLQRRALSWYSGEVGLDNERWRTPTLCGANVSTGRRVSDIVHADVSSTSHLHSNGQCPSTAVLSTVQKSLSVALSVSR